MVSRGYWQNESCLDCKATLGGQQALSDVPGSCTVAKLVATGLDIRQARARKAGASPAARSPAIASHFAHSWQARCKLSAFGFRGYSRGTRSFPACVSGAHNSHCAAFQAAMSSRWWREGLTLPIRGSPGFGEWLSLLPALITCHVAVLH